MDYFEAVNSRFSVRSYMDRPIEVEKLDRILHAANRAPSAGNLQAYEVYVIKDLGTKMALSRAAYGQDFISSAPVVLVFCCHPARSARRYGERGIQLYAVQDATIACTFAMLAATSLGLGSVWVGAFSDAQVKNLIKAGNDINPVAILPIGYPGEEPVKRSRRDFDDIVNWV